MDDICLTHDNRKVQERVSREALATQSIVLAGWLSDGAPASGNAHHVPLDDLSRAEFDALVGYIRSTDVKLAGTASLRHGDAYIPISNTRVPIYDDGAIWANAQHLVRPAHKYNCPLLWNKVVSAISTQPSVATVAALDSLSDVPCTSRSPYTAFTTTTL